MSLSCSVPIASDDWDVAMELEIAKYGPRPKTVSLGDVPDCSCATRDRVMPDFDEWIARNSTSSLDSQSQDDSSVGVALFPENLQSRSKSFEDGIHMLSFNHPQVLGDSRGGKSPVTTPEPLVVVTPNAEPSRRRSRSGSVTHSVCHHHHHMPQPHVSAAANRRVAKLKLASLSLLPERVGNSPRKIIPGENPSQPPQCPPSVVAALEEYRQLPQLLVEAINMGDPKNVEELMTKYCCPSVKASLQYAENCKVKQCLEIESLSALSCYVAAMQAACPDGLVEIKTQKITVLPSGASNLIFTVDFNGQKVVKLIGDCGFVKLSVASAHSSEEFPYLSPRLEMTSIDLDATAGARQIESMQLRLGQDTLATGFKPDSLPFDGTSRITISINADNRIDRIQVLYSHRE